MIRLVRVIVAGVMAVAAEVPVGISSHASPLQVRTSFSADDPLWQRPFLEMVRQNLGLENIVREPWWLETLRSAVFDCWQTRSGRAADVSGSVENRIYYAGCGEIEPSAFDIAWVLVRFEWQGFLDTVDPLERAEAAWHLQQAVNELRYLATRSHGPQGEALQRVRVAGGYLEVAETQLSAIENSGRSPISDSALRSTVRRAINTTLSLDRLSQEPLQTIVGPIVNLMRSAITSYLVAVAAEAQGKAAAVLVYGAGPEARREALAPTESLVLDPTQIGDPDASAWVAQAVRERPLAVGIAQRYADLKAKLWGSDELAAKYSADNLYVRTQAGGRLSLLDIEKATATCQPTSGAQGSQNSEHNSPAPDSCITADEARRHIGPEEFNSFFMHQDRENDIQLLLSHIMEGACSKELGGPAAPATCALLAAELSAVAQVPATSDLIRAIQNRAYAQHLPYFQGEGKEADSLLSQRIIAALASDKVALKSNVVNERIDGLKRALDREFSIDGFTLALPPSAESQQGSPLFEDQRQACRLVSALNETLPSIGLNRIVVPDCEPSTTLK